VAVLDAIVLSRLDPSLLLGLELNFLEAVSAGQCRPALIVHTLTRETGATRLVSVGRYHLYGGPDERAGIGAYRRLTGGRVVGAGEGWLSVALILPTRHALLKERDSILKPDQVMNRYVRGALDGLRALGLECFYPGRDAITINKREIAMCSFETDAGGAMLFEITIALSRGMEDLVHDLERFDSNGDLTCPMYNRENAATVARDLGRDVAFDELADALLRGYADALGEIERRDLTPAERSRAERRGAELMASGWLIDRKLDRAFNRVGVAGSQLGMVEAHLRFRGGEIERLMLTGDFIANSSGLREFESALARKPLDLPTVSAAAIHAFGDGSNYILGIGELANLVKLVMKAA